MEYSNSSAIPKSWPLLMVVSVRCAAFVTKAFKNIHHPMDSWWNNFPLLKIRNLSNLAIQYGRRNKKKSTCETWGLISIVYIQWQSFQCCKIRARVEKLNKKGDNPVTLSLSATCFDRKVDEKSGIDHWHKKWVEAKWGQYGKISEPGISF